MSSSSGMRMNTCAPRGAWPAMLSVIDPNQVTCACREHKSAHNVIWRSLCDRPQKHQLPFQDHQRERPKVNTMQTILIAHSANKRRADSQDLAAAGRMECIEPPFVMAEQHHGLKTIQQLRSNNGIIHLKFPFNSCICLVPKELQLVCC